jgi:NADH-quinone oxidoreductase subunit C
MATKAGKQDAARAKSPTRAPSQQIHQAIAARFGDVVELVDAVDPYTVIKDAGRFLEIMRFLREDDQMQFDFLRSVTGVDWPNENVIDSVYHLYSYALAHAHVVKFRCPREAPEIPTVEGIWAGANWFEREQYDLLGIKYTGHSDLRRIMLPDDWVGHPLRKDYIEQEDYRGIGTTRASPLEAYKKMDEARKKTRDEKGLPKAPPVKSSITPPEGWEPPKKKGAAADDDEEAEA